MRVTLEQLNAMSDEDLKEHWMKGQFPFDTAKGCSKCMTMHARKTEDVLTCYLPEHEALVHSAQQANIWHNHADALRKNLEQIYALRLFYDSLYAAPAEQEAEIAAQQVADDAALRVARNTTAGVKQVALALGVKL